MLRLPEARLTVDLEFIGVVVLLIFNGAWRRGTSVPRILAIWSRRQVSDANYQMDIHFAW
jgi:hypothetical protein